MEKYKIKLTDQEIFVLNEIKHALENCKEEDEGIINFNYENFILCFIEKEDIKAYHSLVQKI